MSATWSIVGCSHPTVRTCEPTQEAGVHEKVQHTTYACKGLEKVRKCEGGPTKLVLQLVHHEHFAEDERKHSFLARKVLRTMNNCVLATSAASAPSNVQSHRAVLHTSSYMSASFISLSHSFRDISGCRVPCLKLQ